MNYGLLRLMGVSKHLIKHLPSKVPSGQCPPYKFIPKLVEHEKVAIDMMLGIIVTKPAQTRWAAPIVIIQDGDRSLPIFAFHWKLEAVPMRNSYPIPEWMRT